MASPAFRSVTGALFLVLLQTSYSQTTITDISHPKLYYNLWKATLLYINKHPQVTHYLKLKHFEAFAYPWKFTTRGKFPETRCLKTDHSIEEFFQNIQNGRFCPIVQKVSAAFCLLTSFTLLAAFTGWDGLCCYLHPAARCVHRAESISWWYRRPLDTPSRILYQVTTTHHFSLFQPKYALKKNWVNDWFSFPVVQVIIVTVSCDLQGLASHHLLRIFI